MAATDFVDVVQLGREVWVSVHQASIAHDSDVVAWSKASGPDLFFADDQGSSALWSERTRYGCGQSAHALPELVRKAQ
jgi:hypothetical protein